MTDKNSAQINIDKANFSLAVIQVIGKDLKRIAEQLNTYQNSKDQQSLSLDIAKALQKHSVAQNSAMTGLPVMPDESESVSGEPLFFIPCVLDLQDEQIEPMFLAQLVELSRQYNFLPIGLQSNNLALAEQAAYAGLALFSQQYGEIEKQGLPINSLLVERLRDQPEQETVAEVNNGSDALGDEPDDMTVQAASQPMIHYQSVGEGEQIYAQGCDLIVLGDVESGAEVIADGSIHIGGALMGKAYAANNEDQACSNVCIKAYSFEPELISISGFYQLREDIPAKYSGLSVEIYWQNGSFDYRLS